ncbi:MAG: hypothetical protein GYB67_19115 [Chloroflexi bacterium]|nr:hypothetical protein [Chloroflexota bacterium]
MADTPATLQAERQMYIAEATSIAREAEILGQEVAATAAAAATYVAQMEAINDQLVATLRVADPPPARRGVGGGASALGSAPPGDVTAITGERFGGFSGTAASTRESDGCITEPQQAFAADVGRVYAGVEAFDIRAGVTMGVEWYYEGQTVWTETFTLDQPETQICLWFYIDPSLLDLREGRWSVQLFADNIAVMAPMAFTIGTVAGDTME